MMRHAERGLLTAPKGHPAGSSAAREDSGIEGWKRGQSVFGSLNIIGEIPSGIACDHPLIEGAGVDELLAVSHDGCGSDRTGGAEGLWIDGGAEGLFDRMVAPQPYPGRRVRSFRSGCAFQLFDGLNEDIGIGCRHAALIRFPVRHHRRDRLRNPSVEGRQSLASGQNT